MKILKFKTEEEIENVVLELLRCGVHFTFNGDFQIIVWTD